MRFKFREVVVEKICLNLCFGLGPIQFAWIEKSGHTVGLSSLKLIPCTSSSTVLKNALHPFIEGRLMPIVPDDYVAMEFGTSTVKITPAHDPNNFTLG
jgi:hypothetical protein